MIEVIYPDKEIYIFSSVYNHLDKIENFIDLNKGCIFILNGNICGQEDRDKVLKDIERLRTIIDNNQVYYLIGNLDLIFLKDCYRNLIINDNLNWLKFQSLCCKVQLLNQTIVNVVCGGLDVNDYKINKIDSCFINDEEWHQKYNGNLGLIISNYPNSLDGSRKIYEYSCSIGVSPDKLSYQKISNQGLSDFIVI